MWPLDASASPETVVLAALAARDAWQYDRVAALTDPASMAELFRGVCEMARPRTFEDFLRDHPDVPAERAEAAFARLQAAMGDVGQRLPRLEPAERARYLICS